MAAALPFAAVATQSVQINEMNNSSASYLRNLKTSNNKKSIYAKKVLKSFKAIKVQFGKPFFTYERETLLLYSEQLSSFLTSLLLSVPSTYK